MIKTSLKSEMYISDNLEFYVESTDYNTAEYSAKIIFLNDSNKIVLNSTFNSVNFNYDFNATNIETKLYKKGKYSIYVLFEKNDGSFQKTFKLENSFNILTDISSAEIINDRITNKEMLKAIEDLIAGRSKEDYNSYKIKDREIVKMTIKELLSLKNYFEREVEKDEIIETGKNKNAKIILKYVGKYRY